MSAFNINIISKNAYGPQIAYWKMKIKIVAVCNLPLPLKAWPLARKKDQHKDRSHPMASGTKGSSRWYFSTVMVFNWLCSSGWPYGHGQTSDPAAILEKKCPQEIAHVANVSRSLLFHGRTRAPGTYFTMEKRRQRAMLNMKKSAILRG